MPVGFYLDDPLHVSDEYVYHASFFAIATLGIECKLVGNPPRFQPLNPSPRTFLAFTQRYQFFLEKLVMAVQAARPTQ